MSLKTIYWQKILPSVKEKLKLQNINAVPKIEKIVLNVGIGSYLVKKDKDFSVIVDGLASISGQKPVVINSKKAVSNFKLRKNMPNGIKVTLRGEKMLSFLDRLVNVAIPRTRDFRGVSTKAFDGKGNYSMGIKEITIFPEIRIEDVNKIYGLQVNISTTATSSADTMVLLKEIGIPFRK